MKESTYSNEEGSSMTFNLKQEQKSRIWQLHLMQVFLLAGPDQCKQTGNHFQIFIPAMCL